MPSADQIRHGVDKYVRLLQEGTAEELTNLFAEGAELVDPAGTPAKTGHAAIRAHFDLAAPYDMTTELLAARIAGDSAAAYFRVTTKTTDGVFVSAPIDVFMFDDEGKVTSLRAYWGPDDYTAP
jgi:steroid Delta-isomerase